MNEPTRSDRNFPTTMWTRIEEANADPNGEAVRLLCESYYAPIHALIQRLGHGDISQDLTHEFFLHFLGKRIYEKAEPGLGRFRSLLIAACKNYLSDLRNRDLAEKRGGGVNHHSIHAANGENGSYREPSHGLTPEILFELDWISSLIKRCVKRLEGEADGNFDVLKLHLPGMDSPPIAESAGRLGVSESRMNYLIGRSKERFKVVMREEIAFTLRTPSNQEIDDEIRHLLSLLARHGDQGGEWRL